MSLAVLKANIIDFVIKPVEREWDAKKLEQVKANQNQLDLFEQKEVFEVVKKLLALADENKHVNQYV